jgi:hypothetical protein
MIGFVMKILIVILSFLLFSTKVYSENLPGGFIVVKEDQIVWKTVEQGVKQATLYGDPSKPGMYVVRNIFPAGIWSLPHQHDQDRFITVMRGVWYVGSGPDWNTSSSIPVQAGSLMLHPANAMHFDGAIEVDTEVQIIGMGPVKTIWTYPKEGRFGYPHQLSQ